MSIVANSAISDESPERFIALISIPHAIAGMVVLPNDLITDRSLSFDARGLLAYLCSLPGPVTVAEMVAATADGIHTTRRALDELIARDLADVVTD